MPPIDKAAAARQLALAVRRHLAGTDPGAVLFLGLSPRSAAALGPLGAGRTRVPAAPRLDALLDLVDA
ncbi:MAG: hypothetical protein ACOVOI_17205, partial [Hyphomicrobiales bacterium]